jgi:hypothetical protein
VRTSGVDANSRAAAVDETADETGWAVGYAIRTAAPASWPVVSCSRWSANGARLAWLPLSETGSSGSPEPCRAAMRRRSGRPGPWQSAPGRRLHSRPEDLMPLPQPGGGSDVPRMSSLRNGAVLQMAPTVVGHMAADLRKRRHATGPMGPSVRPASVNSECLASPVAGVREGGPLPVHRRRFGAPLPLILGRRWHGMRPCWRSIRPDSSARWLAKSLVLLDPHQGQRQAATAIAGR